MKKKYRFLKDGEWVFPTMDKHIRGCCDCGLVHRVDMRIVRKIKGGVKILPSKKMGIHIATRAYRDEKESKKLRKAMKEEGK